MAAAELDGSVLRLAGELDHASVPALASRATALLQAAGTTVQLDCSGVSRANSAALALVLVLMRSAQSRNQQLVIGYLPQDMQQMAQVCELAEVLQPEPTH